MRPAVGSGLFGAPPSHPPGIGAAVPSAESAFTWANLVTTIRLIACLVLFGFAAASQNERLNFVGLGVYWVLDVVDGFLARKLHQETRLGAQMDILADRLLVFFFYLNYLSFHPGLLVPIVLFVVQFAGIDHYLSNQFMRWPVLSPNYFYLVDRPIWLWNWSAPGKLLNSAVITGLLVLTQSVWLSSAAAIAIIGLKLWSCIRMTRLVPPEIGWRPLR